MANIIIHCWYTGEAGSVRGFMEEMRTSGLQQEVLNEDGCMQYEYFLAEKEETRGVLLERWRDAEALDAHANGVPMSKLLPLKDRYGLTTVVEKWEIRE